MPPSLRRWFDRLAPLAALALLVVVTVAVQLLRDGRVTFLKPDNLLNILNQNAVVGITAVGMTLVIILAGIDLSVGSLLAFTGAVGLTTLKALMVGGVPETPAVLTALAVMQALPVAAGGLHGALIARFAVAPFIVTLGALVAYRSCARWIARGGEVSSMSLDLLPALGSGWAIPWTNLSADASRVTPLRLPWSVVALAVVAAVGWVILERTRLGRYIRAVGCNERAARYAAVPVGAVKCWTYSLMGACVGVASMVYVARFGSVSSGMAGELLELDAIAAVVIGGTRMSGGSGSIGGTLVGVLLIAVIGNMMSMLGVPPYPQGLVKGLIIVAAVLVQRVGRGGVRG